jgi:type II secretion system protein N
MQSTVLRKIIKYAGYPLFFLALFVAFLFWTFPLDHFKPAVETQLTKLIDRAVHIDEMSMSLTGDIVLSSVEIEVPPKEDDDLGLEVDDEDGEDGDGEQAEKQPKRPPPKLSYFVDEMVIDVGLFALLMDELDIAIDMDLLGGEVSIQYEGPLPADDDDEQLERRRPKRRPRPRPNTPRRPGAGPAGLPAPDGTEGPIAEEDEEEEDEEEEQEALFLTVEARGLELRQIHDLRAKLPLPITGTLNLSLVLESPTGSFADAAGTLTVDASSVVLGRADAQIDVGGMPLTVDPIAIAAIDCKVEVEEGTAAFTAFETRSKDFDAEIKGDVTFSDPLSRSRFDLYLMFKFLDGYAAKSQKASMLISSLDDFSRDLKRAHRKDGFYGFRYRGLFGSARLSPSKNFRERREGKKQRQRRPRDRKRKDRPRAGAAGLPSGPGGVTGERASPRGEIPQTDVRTAEPPSGAGPAGPGRSGRVDRPMSPVVRPGVGPPEDPGASGAEEEDEEEAPGEEEGEEGEEESGEEESGQEESGQEGGEEGEEEAAEEEGE